MNCIHILTKYITKGIMGISNTHMHVPDSKPLRYIHVPTSNVRTHQASMHVVLPRFTSPENSGGGEGYLAEFLKNVQRTE